MRLGDVVQFYSPLSGGVKRYIHDKIRFVADGAELDHFIIVPSDRNACRLERRTRVYEVRSPPLVGSRSYRALVDRRTIGEIVERERPDILEVGDPYWSARIALDLARRNGIRILAYYHSDYPRALARTIERYAGRTTARLFAGWINGYLVRLYNRMDATVVATSSMLGILSRLGVERLVQVPLGTDPALFFPRGDRRALRRKLNLPCEARLLLYVGRLAREKRVDRLLGMMDCLPPAGRYHLTIVGDGERGRQVRRAARRRADVTWHPYTEDNSRLAEVYSAADLLVHAGLSETFGLVSVEAQACGTRVLAVQGGGLEETLRGESPAIVAAGSSPRDLAAAVRRVFALGEGEEARRQRARRTDRQFGWRSSYVRLVALYRHLCECRPVSAFHPERYGGRDAMYCAAISSG